MYVHIDVLNNVIKVCRRRYSHENDCVLLCVFLILLLMCYRLLKTQSTLEGSPIEQNLDISGL